MSPQWIPQNIQKRLLLYVLQQLSLFSEIDLPNLEEVSLNNILLRDISIDPEKVGKLPGCNLRYGQVSTLELSGGVMGGVNIDADGIEIVIAPDFDIDEEVKNNVQFSLAQSTADLANTIMIEREDDNGEDDDLSDDEKTKAEFTWKSRSDSGSSNESAKSKPSALSGVMAKAVEIALSRLQVKVTNLKIKILSELTDMVIEVDEAYFNTINGVRHIRVNGIRLITLKPDVNPGEFGDDTVDSEKHHGPDTDDDDDNDNDNDDGYGDESLMNSMVFTHEEASSIYMSATSQSFNVPAVDESNAIDNKKTNITKEYPVLLHIDKVDIEFEGLNTIANFEVDIGDIKISSVPSTPSIISIFNGISRSLKIKNHQKRKQRASNYNLPQNSKFPQYVDENDEIDDAFENDNISVQAEPFFNKLHIGNIIFSATSALLPTGDFASTSDNLSFIFQNFNIKQKNELLIYGGVEIFKIVKAVNGEQIEVFNFENNNSSTTRTPTPVSSPKHDSGDSFNSTAVPGVTSPPSQPPQSSSGKADIRFEIFRKNDSDLSIEITTLLSKPAFFNLDSKTLLILINFGISANSIYSAYNLMKSTIESFSSLSYQRKEVDSSIPISSQFILQTASITANITCTENLNIKALIFPISFNSSVNQLLIQKVLISIIQNNKENIFTTISNIQLLTKNQEFRTFVNRTGLPNNNGSNSIPREVIMSSSLTLVLSRVDSSISLKDLKLLVQDLSDFFATFSELSSQINSLDNLLLSSPRSPNKVEASMFLQASFYSNQRRSRRPGPSLNNNATLINTNRLNLATFRLLIKEFEINILEVLPEFGDINIHLNQISFYQIKSDIQGSILSLNVQRNKNNEVIDDFIYEFQRKSGHQIQIPLVLMHLKNNEKINSVDIIVRNFLIEYYTSWLKFLESSNLSDGDNINSENVKRDRLIAPQTSQKRFDLRFTLYDCVIGLNPDRLKCKSFLVINKGNSDVTFGANQFYIKSSLRNLSLLLIDDIKNTKLSNKVSTDSMLPHSSYESPLSYYLSIGYISFGNINCTHIGITVNTDIEEMIKRNKSLGIHDSLSFLDIKINSDEHQLDLCADSTHVLIQLVNDLKLPLNFKNEDKIKVILNEPINLLDDISEDQFKFSSNSNSLDSSTVQNDPSKSIHFSMVDEYYNESHNSSLTIEQTLKNLSMSNLSDTTITENGSSISFEEDHFTNNRNLRNNIKVHPVKMNINLSKTKIYLYDGYDWKETRKTIKGAVKRVEAQAIKEIEKKTERKKTDKKKKNQKIKFNGHDEIITGEDTRESDGGTQEGQENSELIGETLFQSIHLSLPKGANPSDLTDNINSNVQNGNKKGEINVDIGKNYKNLRLRRSKFHKVLVDLKNIEINLTILTTRDPRKDKTDENLKYEILNSIDIRIDTIDIIDNVPSSTWNKFLSYMNSLGEREIGTSMIKLSLINIRPDPSLVSSEVVINVSILPLRLYVDQDTLDFLTRFLEFKDTRFDLPVDEIIYIQRFQINPLKLKLDYKPKKVDYLGIRSGKTSEFMNFFILDGSDITLQQVNMHGISGFPKLSAKLKSIWIPNVQQTQLAGILSGLSPIRSIVNIGGGVKDLIAIPIKEYKKDGRLVRSLQKGTTSFVKTTGYEILNLGAKLASGTQVILEQGEEILGGEGSSARLPKHKNKSADDEEEEDDDQTGLEIYDASKNTRNHNINLLASSQLLNQSIQLDKDQYGSRKLYSHIELDESSGIDNKLLNESLLLLNPKDKRIVSEQFNEFEEINKESESDNDKEDDDPEQKLVSLYSNQPENIHQGIKLAYQSFGKNLKSTKNTLSNLKKEINESDNIQDSLLSILKSSPIILIRPIIGTTEAVSKTLMGLSNEIDSTHIAESKEKYRWDKLKDE